MDRKTFIRLRIVFCNFYDLSTSFEGPNNVQWPWKCYNLNVAFHCSDTFLVVECVYEVASLQSYFKARKCQEKCISISFFTDFNPFQNQHVEIFAIILPMILFAKINKPLNKLVWKRPFGRLHSLLTINSKRTHFDRYIDWLPQNLLLCLDELMRRNFQSLNYDDAQQQH